MENIETVTIKDIKQALFDSYLDTEYHESLAHSMLVLGYVNDSPKNLFFGTPKQKEELEEVENRALTSNEISEIIHLMMYKMRNDFQYGIFKPITLKYLSISERMKNTEQKNNQNNNKRKKLKCNIYNAFGSMVEIIGMTSKKLKQNKMFEESREMIERATESYSYDEALEIINEYIKTIDKCEKKEEEVEYE